MTEKMSTTDLLKQRLKEVHTEKARLEAALGKLQDKLRDDPYDDKLRAKVHEAKREIAQVSDEHGDLARAVATAQGGTNHAPR